MCVCVFASTLKGGVDGGKLKVEVRGKVKVSGKECRWSIVTEYSKCKAWRINLEIKDITHMNKHELIKAKR